MNLLRCCLAAMFVASALGAAVDVEKTVRQVQNILQGNQFLPRLSREEILQLLNDIRAEDAKSSSASKETKSEEITTPLNTNENEITPTPETLNINENLIFKENEPSITPTSTVKSTTTKPEPSVMVVLPYTPRDGSSLQELYTRPPRVERVPLSEITTPSSVSALSSSKIKDTLTQNSKLADKQKLEFPPELQAFLDAHGLTGQPGQDHFLLPLEGFKPLPPAKVVDGTVQLPENILLAYDLISPSDDNKYNSEGVPLPPTSFLYEPLRPEIPFELDTSSSETKETIYPLDVPKSRKTKAVNTPNYEPIDYDSIKVIPLKKGVSPVEDSNSGINSDQNKRQTNTTSEETSTTSQAPEVTTVTEEAKSASTEAPQADAESASADTDSGASIADLEDSFGGPLPGEPGDSMLPPPRKNGFYWMVDWNSFLEVGDGDSKVNIRFEPKLGDPQMFLPVSVP